MEVVCGSYRVLRDSVPQGKRRDGVLRGDFVDGRVGHDGAFVRGRGGRRDGVKGFEDRVDLLVVEEGGEQVAWRAGVDAEMDAGPFGSRVDL